VDRRRKITYFILGLGIGIVISSTFYSFFPVTKFVELSDDIIIERARDLGMVKVKEHILDGEDPLGLDKTKAEAGDVEESQAFEEGGDLLEDSRLENDLDGDNEDDRSIAGEYIDFYVNKGENSYSIAKNLYNLDLISSEEEFIALAEEKNVNKALFAGSYKIKRGLDDISILEILADRKLD